MPTQLPLSWQQQWLWTFLQRYGDWKCVVPHAFRLRGALDVGIFQRCVEEAVRRHGSLRTRIIVDAGVAKQQVDDPCPYPLTTITISGSSPEALEANARRALAEFCDRKVDPSGGPLLSVQLLELQPDEHWLLLAVHRLIADCASTEQVLREIWTLYLEFRHGATAAAPQAPAQYSDYTTWQQRSSTEWSKRHHAYWRERLAGATPLRWPRDPCINGAAFGTVGRIDCNFGSELSEQLRNTARRVRTLAASAMLAVYVASLWCWCGQRDFVLAIKIGGRQSQHKSVVGYFPHLLYLRVALTGEEPFTELLNQVSGEFFRAMAHQDLGRMATQEPELLAGAFFQWITWRRDDVQGPAAPLAPDSSRVAVERIEMRAHGDGLTAIPPGAVNIEVTFFDTDDGIHASGVYRADCFAASTMEQFLADLRSMMEQFVRDPHARFAVTAAEPGRVRGSARVAG